MYADRLKCEDCASLVPVGVYGAPGRNTETNLCSVDAEATRRRLDIWVRERLPLACVTAATRGVKPRNLLNSETNR